MTAILETRRLRLCEFHPDDLDTLAAMVADEEHGFGFWLIESRPTSEFLAYCGIRPLELDGAPATEIGWHTKKTSWNRGIATESAAGVRDLALARFAQTRLVALIHPDHLASRRVAEKIGMCQGAEIVFDGDPYVTYLSERA